MASRLTIARMRKVRFWSVDAVSIRANNAGMFVRDYSSDLSHVDTDGKASMVDVGKKKETRRSALASASIRIGRETFELVKANQMKKGDVLTVSQLAGIMGAKQTSSLIPLCHPLLIDKVGVELKLNEDCCSVDILCEVNVCGKTGVEMEALTGASVAALTVYDMCKAVTKDMVIGEVKLVKKSGGKSGDFDRDKL